jgi:hypothetical protein
MKKIFIVLLVLISMSTLIACNQTKIDSPEAINIYSNLSGSKGLELYVWSDTKTSQVFCGLLEGTNRNKNEQDFKIVRSNPVTIEKMVEILGGYNKDLFVIIIGLDGELTGDTTTLLKSCFDKLQMPNILYPQ